MQRIFAFLAGACLWLLLALPAQAAVTCSLQKFCSGSASSGTWQAFVLPSGTAYVIIEVDGAAWVDGPGGAYTDNAARSSGGRATSSGEPVGLPIAVSSSTTSIYVAGNGGSRTVTIYVAGPEGR